MIEVHKRRRKPACRALGDAQKDQRRETILKAALGLFGTTEFEVLTMAELAKRAGLAKGTVYLYFPTKESLFLGLTLELMEDWFRALTSELSVEGSDESRIVAKTLAERPVLRRLMGLLHNTLEKNVDESTVRDFKLNMISLMQPVAKLIEERLPVLEKGEGACFLMRIYALAIGIGQIASPPSIVAKVLQAPELACFRIDFEEEFYQCVRLLLAGRLAKQG
jgi:AcrR family transcriptional regulator